MVDRKRVFLLVSVMAVVAIAVGGMAINVLYKTAIVEERARLIETAQSQARLMEAVARFDQQFSQHDNQQGAVAATISQIVDAHERYQGFGATGEFTLARREGDQIVFLLSHRHDDLDEPNPVPFDGITAEPMRRALSGRSGTVVGLDYRGVMVLAAHEPVAELDLGIVAKIDMSEIRAPFLQAGVAVALLSLALIAVGTVLILRISTPMIEALRESEDRYARAVSGANDGLWDWNIKTDASYFSPRFSRILRYDESDLKPVLRTFLDLLHPDDRERTSGAIRAHLKEDASYDIEFRLRCKDGEYKWVHSRGQAIRDEQGEPTSMAGTVTDISERKWAEKALEERTSLLSAIIEGTADAVFLKDVEGRYMLVNSTVAKMAGRSVEDIVGVDDARVFSPEIAEEMRSVDRSVIEHKETQHVEQAIRVGGETRLTEVTKSPHFDADGNVIGIIGIAHDITERKQAEEALREAHQHLERRVEERTQELRLQAEVLENMAEGVVLIRTSDAAIVFANPKFEAMFGYEPGELLGKPVAVLNVPSDISPEEAARVIMNSLAEEGSWSGEVNNVKKDGSHFWCHANVSTFSHREYGEILVSVHEDITRRKRALMQLHEAHDELEVRVEERTRELSSEIAEHKRTLDRLRESEDRFRGAFDGSGVGMVLVNSKGQYVQVNQALCDILGYSEEELLSLGTQAITHPDDLAVADEIVRRQNKWAA
jgi:PAS domain S-box-containing protein